MVRVRARQFDATAFGVEADGARVRRGGVDEFAEHRERRRPRRRPGRQRGKHIGAWCGVPDEEYATSPQQHYAARHGRGDHKKGVLGDKREAARRDRDKDKQKRESRGRRDISAAGGHVRGHGALAAPALIPVNKK
jgi:hypothetical protein